MTSTCLQDFSDDSVFLTWNWIEISVVVSPEIYWSFFNFFQHDFQSRFPGVEKNYSRMKFLETSIVSYWLSELSKTFLEFRPKIWALLSMLHYKFHEELFDDNVFQGITNLFCISSVWLKLLLTFYGNLSAGLPKLHFAFTWIKTLRYEKFSFRNIILLNIYYLDQLNSQTFVIFFGPSFQNCF